MEPTLRAGMDFLRDDGSAIGCIANRYMLVEDAAGRPTDKSYGMSLITGNAAYNDLISFSIGA